MRCNITSNCFNRCRMTCCRLNPVAATTPACFALLLTRRRMTCCRSLHRVRQVLKSRLAVNCPTLMTAGGFDYVEGEGLEEDEAAEAAAQLPKPLTGLPGGGLGHGAILEVDDFSQALKFDVIICHQVRVRLLQCVL